MRTYDIELAVRALFMAFSIHSVTSRSVRGADKKVEPNLDHDADTDTDAANEVSDLILRELQNLQDVPSMDMGRFEWMVANDDFEVIPGDFNNDGLMDIAVFNKNQGSMWKTIPIAFATTDGRWEITNANVGNFFTKKWVASGNMQIIPGDFNGDGFLDIALVNHKVTSGWETIPVAFGRGNGTFQILDINVGENFASKWTTTEHVEIIPGDFNGDGITDIALVGGSDFNSIPVIYGSKNKTWDLRQRLVYHDFTKDWARKSSVKVISGDFDGDGMTDIALINQSYGWKTIPVAYGTPTGFDVKGQSEPGPIVNLFANDGVKAITGDFNRDGKDDIALVNDSTFISYIYTNGREWKTGW